MRPLNEMEALLKKNMREQHEATERSVAEYNARTKAERAAFAAAGGYAYPSTESGGMTLREHYAGQAMQGLLQACATQGTSPTPHIAEICREAVSAADELLHALKHNKTGDQNGR
jgi:D-serine deaminase-like pyridoxal phosphate-dependent protein